ncbi:MULTISPECIES: MarR family winged helix-turn-helix transcriptional regulator [unclassified Streptomyces]|uniref:MarR family winged helix-turn-helix transcriptional regulator n=2 Tax=Streptomyces TaxID=1883 RepID=UPI00224DFFDA|nr:MULTISPECIES: MarR family transcriptional regulator [unclassified Streptomyces]MCX5059680.1 MarR family transcriptional regulator [Streptomyces sp. NBC_00452]MCX5290594.1 MarR family transcriptional regulator [Streptomyces sp. NBC_00183]
MIDNSTHVSELAPALMRLMAELTRKTRALFGDGGLDLTPDQFAVLQALAEHTDLITQAQLAAELAREKTVVLRQIDSLEKRGLLERVADPDDRRKRGLVLTDEGRRVHAAAKIIVDRLMTELVGDMPAEELRGVIKCLDEIRAKTQSL